MLIFIGVSVMIVAAMFFYSWLLAPRKKPLYSALRKETDPLAPHSPENEKVGL